MEMCYLYDGIPVDRSSSTGRDADTTRVAKGRITAWSCDPAVNGFQTTSDYILGPSGEQVTEMAMDANNSMAWQHTNVYAPGLGSSALLATYDNDGLHFYLNDPLPGSPATGLRRWGGLGTRRAQTDYAGVLEQTCSSLPFGDALACSGGNLQAPTEHHFTGKERDTESGNDYFGARYFGSSMGRFMSPDPLLNSGRPDNPQTWNRYAYALNNPLKIVDPTGLYNLDDGCLQNKACAANAKKLRDGLSDLEHAVNGMKDGADKDRLQGALDKLGYENDGNDVGVSFAPVQNGAGHTDALADSGGNLTGFKVTLDPSKIGSSDSYAIDAAHESTHINNMLSGTNYSDFTDEYRAYQTSAWAAGALWQYHGANGTGTFTLNGKNGNSVIWNSSWGAVDDKVLTKYITNEYHYQDGRPYQETTPHDGGKP
jgi:RHS repeat-associated protein